MAADDAIEEKIGSMSTTIALPYIVAGGLRNRANFRCEASRGSQAGFPLSAL